MASSQTRAPDRSRPAGVLGERAVLGWALGLAAVAAIGVLVFTRHGVLLAPDSVTYVSAARNLVAGNGFTDFTAEALVQYRITVPEGAQPACGA